MSGFEVGICLFPTASASDTAERARRADELGFAFVGVGDVHGLWRDVYVTLSLCATRTRRVRLGPWVTNPVTRHPSVTANAVLSLHEMSGGRALLGIGVGDGAVATIDHRPASLDALAAAILAIGASFAAPGARRAAAPIPIYWAAAGARSLAYGGRCADGVIVSGWLVPELMQRALAHVREGIAAAGRRPDQVELIFNTAVSVDQDRGRAIEAAKPYVARALARASSAWLPDWAEADVRRFREHYDFTQHFSAGQQLKDLVPDSMVPRKAVAGSPEECLALIQAVREAGFGKIALIPVGDVDQGLRTVAETVLPRV